MTSDHDVIIVSRAEWGARELKATNCMRMPVSVVFIHYTAGTEGFNQEYSNAMRDIQNYHMNVKDIISLLLKVIPPSSMLVCSYSLFAVLIKDRKISCTFIGP